jgi:HlyD family secretion protein
MLIVIAGSALVSFWVYQKYFKAQEPNILSFKVEQGSIKEVIRVRGEVAAQKEIDLEFPLAGTVQEILVSQGQEVREGDVLIKLETTDFELELQKFQSQLKQSMANVESAKANLAKYRAALAREQAKLVELEQGTREEELQIAKTAVSNAKRALDDAKINLDNVSESGYRFGQYLR